MTREIHDIPPAPRRVRWRAVLWHWWPVAFLGFVFGVYGGLITLMLVLARGGKPADDRLLDLGSVITEAVVTGVEGGIGDQPPRVAYRFRTPNGTEYDSRSFPRRAGIAVDDRIDVEFVAERPYINRIVGGRIAMVPRLHLGFLWVFLTGVLCTGVWIARVLLLRRLMAHGDVAAGAVLESTPIHLVSPSMLRVRYSYRGHDARERTGAHWVRARSVLGERLAANPKQIAVLHDRGGRGASRLVMADDFLPATPLVGTRPAIHDGS